MEKTYRVKINPTKSWEDRIKESYGPLSGYYIDLKDKKLKGILLEILKYQGEGMIKNQNYLNIREIYLDYIRNLQEDLEKEDNVLIEEINTLKSLDPSEKTVDILLKYGVLPGIEFFIPYEKTYGNGEYADIMGENNYKGTDVESPYKAYWDGIFKDVNYIPLEKLSFNYKDTKLNVQVLIFSKAKSELYDVTKFLSGVDTSVFIGSGGNFNLKIHLVSIKNLKEQEHLQDNNINVTGYTKALFLQSIFRDNDVVFIRFENLKCEDFSNKKKIRGRYWDMIGLIDNMSIMSDYNSMNINIVGRDLVKLLIDDNNIFIPLQWASNPQTIFGGENSKIINRLFCLEGEYNSAFTRSFRSIENSIGFILSQLTHIEILSSDCITFLKNEYGDDLSNQFRYTQAGRKEKELKINGIWGLVNYYVDEKLSHLRLADASLKNPNGSTMQQILKVCQSPFVEVIADTFVDKYNLIIRKPPFSLEDISKQKFFVVERDNCISDTLEFSRDIYTVFQIVPQGGCFADNSSISYAYLPMVVLDDYTKLWGNRLYSQVFGYIDIDTYNQLENKEKKQKILKEVYIDALCWLIETTAYLPFSRTGKITIKGDRRIKVGQWIYYEKTNEVFYVNSVSHSTSINNGNINRVTILEVNRGLVKNYIKPAVKIDKSFYEHYIIEENGKRKMVKEERHKIDVSNMSYADLVDIYLLKNALKELLIKFNKDFLKREIKEGDNFVTNPSFVSSEVFDFFLKGHQFEGKVNPYTIHYSKNILTLNEIEEEQNGVGRGNGTGYTMSMNSSTDDGKLQDWEDKQNEIKEQKARIKQNRKIKGNNETITKGNPERPIYTNKK